MAKRNLKFYFWRGDRLFLTPGLHCSVEEVFDRKVYGIGLEFLLWTLAVEWDIKWPEVDHA